MAIHQEQTLKLIYNAEVAANLLRKYVVTFDVANSQAQLYTLISSATAVQASLATYNSNYANLP
jgi:hypothetical protein